MVEDGRPCCGVVYNPASDELYSARIGNGAQRDGAAIHVGGRTGLEGCAMLGDRSQLTLPPFPPMQVQNRNSVAWRLALVAGVLPRDAVKPTLDAAREPEIGRVDRQHQRTIDDAVVEPFGKDELHALDTAGVRRQFLPLIDP